uniref:LY6/PLAUR domain containing 1 n=2 Tax=Esox lucius TaxID=8010 RepID=A0AAY5K295_ESOLU
MYGICPQRYFARSDVSVTIYARRRMRLLTYTTLFWFILKSGLALQIQCYQCEEAIHNECSTPEFIVNCTVNVQDMCQKEVLVKEDGVHYRKSCASSGACLIASSGYQQFCTGKLNSVCISCCNTPLCNGPSQKKQSSRNRVPSAASSQSPLHRLSLLFLPFILRAPSILC